MVKRSDSHPHYSTRLPERDATWDVIVIGSGMGGMTTAAMLAKLGKRVLVLEQHYVPGGFTHTFRRKRWTWDVGVHAIGEVTDRALLGRVLHALTDGKLEWAPLGRTYDEFTFPDLRIDFAGDRGAWEQELLGAFPHAGPSIATYMRRTKDVSSAMGRYYLSRLTPPSWSPVSDTLLASRAHRELRATTAEVMAGITSDARLLSVLTAQWGYYGSPPSRSSFAIHALVARHFLHGGYYPVGGAQRIAETLLTTVADAGGATVVHAPVAEVIVDNDRAVGVRLSSGATLRSRAVVSAVGGIPTVTRLLPEPHKHADWARSIARLAPSPCHVCLYLGFKGDIREDGATAANQWFYETWDSRAETWHISDPASRAPVLYCSFPSLKDPKHDPGADELHTGEVVTFVPYAAFAGYRDAQWSKRGPTYKAWKTELQERLLEQFFSHMPRLRNKLAYAELSTPVSTEYFTRSAQGAIYGIEPTPLRYRTRALRPRTPIAGLFLSGGDMASVGVMGAMVGGLLAATAMEPVAAAKWLRPLVSGR